jgi:phosphoglucosamine mutase
MSASIFGTDGVRGTPGEYPLDQITIARLGASTVRVIDASHPKFLVARDTRESGPWIERQIAAGVAAEHGTLVSVGVMPTPAAAFLSASDGFDAAFVISASHNPFPDNGIKVLTGDGAKASPELEAQLSDAIRDTSWPASFSPVEALETRDLTGAYAMHARRVLSGAGHLASSRIAVDCANGAMSVVAPGVFRQLGFDVIALNAEPDGRNINEGCGSTHAEGLQEIVRSHGCRLGVAFDGDGDRAILVDDLGDVVDGDAMLFICATHLESNGALPGSAVVATVMSNIGLEIALRRAGIVVHRCPVGDRQVFEEMRRRGTVLGGEQSGHIIFSDLLPTGDGLLTTLSVLKAMVDTRRDLSELRTGLEVYPQILLNVRVRAKPDLATQPDITEAIRHAEATLGSDGRVLVRYSGTEPLLRVMIEGRDQLVVNDLADAIATCARDRLGSVS